MWMPFCTLWSFLVCQFFFWGGAGLYNHVLFSFSFSLSCCFSFFCFFLFASYLLFVCLCVYSRLTLFFFVLFCMQGREREGHDARYSAEGGDFLGVSQESGRGIRFLWDDMAFCGGGCDIFRRRKWLSLGFRWVNGEAVFYEITWRFVSGSVIYFDEGGGFLWVSQQGGYPFLMR